MDALTFIVEMTKALAWPAVAGAGLLLGRKPLGVLIEGLRLQRLKGAGWEFEFAELEAKVQGTVEHVVAELPAADKPPLKFLKTFSADKGDLSPLETIITAWVKIEDRVREAAKGAEGASERAPFGAMLKALVGSGRVSEATAEGLRGLQQLRNLAVHAPRDAALAMRAPEFRAMSDAMLWSLEHDLKRQEGEKP